MWVPAILRHPGSVPALDGRLGAVGGWHVDGSTGWRHRQRQGRRRAGVDGGFSRTRVIVGFSCLLADMLKSIHWNPKVRSIKKHQNMSDYYWLLDIIGCLGIFMDSMWNPGWRKILHPAKHKYSSCFCSVRFAMVGIRILQICGLW